MRTVLDPPPAIGRLTLGRAVGAAMLLAMLALPLGAQPLPRAPVILEHPQSQLLVVGDQLTLTVSVLPGILKTRYQWFRNGQPLEGQDTATLVIDNVQLTNSGVYTVTVSNGSGSRDSEPATVGVAQIETPGLQAPSASLGATVQLRLRLNGTTASTIQWFHEGTLLNGETHLQLTLTNVQAAEGGVYAVQAYSPLSATAVEPRITLEVDPTFTVVNALPSEPGPYSRQASWGDYDGDGNLDLFVANSGDRPLAGSLYHNEGPAGDGTYTFSLQTNNLTRTIGAATEGKWGDYDNDGRLDLFLPIFSPPNYQTALGHLFHNDGGGSFSVVQPPPGGGTPSTWFSAWGDYDGDGYLDLLLANFYQTANSLFHNQGGQSFQSVTTGPLVRDAKCWGPAGWFDYDEDGNLDAFVRAGIPEPQYDGLYRNLGNGSFARITNAPFVQDLAAKWGGFAWGDYDNDGHADLLLTRFEPPGVQLYHNDGSGNFSLVTNAAGIQPINTMAVTWLDYDNDGFLDIVATPDTQNGTNAPPYLYRNSGPGPDGWAFQRVTSGSLANQIGTWHGCSAADYDNDGFLDIFLANTSTNRNLLFHNNGNSNGWLVVKCIGRGTNGLSNRDAIGANVRLRATFGGTEWTQMRTIGLDSSPGQNDPRAHFGLGDATNVTTLRIEWPSGIVQEFADVAPRRYVTVEEPFLKVLVDGASKSTGAFSFDPNTAVTLSVPTNLLATSYQWQLNGADIPGATDPTLVIPAFVFDNVGRHNLQIQGVDPTLGAFTATLATNRTVQIDLAGVPRGIIVPNPNYVPSLGVTVFLRASFSGTPPFTYQWMRESLPIDPAANATATTDVLRLTNVTLFDQANYTVVVSNDRGTNQASYFLKLDPTFTKITGSPIVALTGDWRGAAWGDYDGDGYLDLFIARRDGISPLFRNNGDGTFTQVVAGKLGTQSEDSVGGIWADYDNDGHLDLFVVNNGYLPPFRYADYLFRNEGQGQFVIQTNTPFAADKAWSLSAAWADYDSDGKLDLFVAADDNRGYPSSLYHNDGSGQFSVVTSSPIVAKRDMTGSAWADYDNDGLEDLFVACGGNADPGANDLLFRNLGGGAFELLTNSVVCRSGGSSAGCAWGDYDNDGRVDLFVSNINGESDFLFHNEGGGQFVAVPDSLPASDHVSTSAGSWADYDNDGYLDLFVLCDGLPNRLYHNRGDGTFELVTTGSPVGEVATLRGCVAWADYDRDGFLDLLRTGRPSTCYLYHNNGNNNGWLIVQCVGWISNRSGIGAKVRMKATIRSKELWQLREVTGGDSLTSPLPLYAHFGLGDATNVTTLRIEWPSGIKQEFYDQPVKRYVTIEEPFLAVTCTNTLTPSGILEVNPGETVTLGVSLTNLVGATYQWRFNGQDLAGETNATLVRTIATTNDVGAYRVVVTGQTESYSITNSPAKPLAVDFSGKPEITDVRFLTPSSVSLGAPVTNRVWATGAAESPLFYQWQFDGTNLDAALNPSATNQVLAIAAATLADAGSCRVIVWSERGLVTSTNLVLGVDPTFTKITTGELVNTLSVAECEASAFWGDYDGDGFVDLLLNLSEKHTPPLGISTNYLYHNNGDGSFTRVTEGPLTTAWLAQAAAWADSGNRGALDLLCSSWTNTIANNFTNHLASSTEVYQNDGRGNFTLLPLIITNLTDYFALAVDWIDYDNDGWLDFFLGRGDFAIVGTTNRLFRNRGDGTFAEVTTGTLVTNRNQFTTATAWADFDNDGRIDLVAGQYLRPTAFYRNLGNGEFAQPSYPFGNSILQGSLTYADFDNDGDFDVVMKEWWTRNMLFYVNAGDGTFTHRSPDLQFSKGSGFAGFAWGDYDNDGWLDFAAGSDVGVAVFHNNGDGTFTEVTTGSPANDRVDAHWCSWVDLDRDGFLDLYVGPGQTAGAPQLLYHNNGNTNGWLVVRPRGTVSSATPVGAKVRVLATLNPNLDLNPTPTWQLRQITASGQYTACYGEGQVAHFGLGQATNVTTLRIEWPSGIVQELHDVAPKQYLTNVVEPDLKVAPKSVEFVGGTDVTFTASTSIASAQFQWQFQGNALAGETSSSITVSNLTALKAGKYTVVISTTGTTETASASGVIQPAIPPAIAQPPQSLTVDPGSAATFQVTATGSMPLAYQWLLNDAAIAGATNASLLISHVQPADAGEYVLVVTNPGGVVRSTPALLSLVGAPKIVVQPKDQSVSLGATVTFSVVPDGTAPFSFQWRTNGGVLLGAMGQTMTLLNVQAADSGLRFSVVVSNALGNITSREAVLEVDATFAKVTAGGLADDLGHYHGQAWGDYNNDGYLDLLMVGLTPADDAIFRNNGDGTFTKIHPSPWQRSPNPYVWAYGWGDYDNDGFLDLYFGDQSSDGQLSSSSVLLRNNGAGGFTSVGAVGGMAHFSGAWADADKDGRLDFATAGWGPGGPYGMIHFYRNQGDGTFKQNVLEGLFLGSGYVAPAWVDLDNDGWLDLFVTHCGANNAVFLNRGQGAFTNLTEGVLVNDPGKWMASAWGDYDNDGNLDVFVTASGGQPNALYHNDGHGVFKKMTAAEVGSLVADGGSSWGCAWGDYDNDGWLDLFVANAGGQGNFLYHNNGDGTFTRVSSGSLANDLAESITCNWVDYDQDGFLDLFVQNHAWPEAPGVVTPNFLYRNSTNSNHWLAVKCVGTLSPRWGTGAKVRLQANIGGRTLWQMRVIDVGGTWFGGLSFVAHFGLGDASRAETVRVEWPSGIVQELLQVPPNRYLTVRETVINLSASALDVVPGQSVMLQVSPPLPSASYQWRRDGQAIPGATGATLELTNVSAADLGEYTVVVTRFDNDLGAPVATVSLPVRLNLAIKPEVGVPTFEPESVSLGAAVTAQAAVSGTAPLSYQWQLNGTDLPGQTNSILDLTNVRLSDAGPYRLVVTNAMGQMVGPEARLEVDPTFTKITSGPMVTDAFEQWSHAWVDYDNDGDLDLAVISTEYPPGGGPPSLVLVIYRNDGNGVFTRQSQSFPGTVAATYYSSWGDYDNDGYPDLFLPVWSETPLLGIQANNILLHNEGNGTFRQVTTGVVAQEGGVSTMAAWCDYNRDGWLDLFVANSEQGSAPWTNWMYLNQGNGAFVKLTPEQVGAPLLDVGLWYSTSWADVDDDGWPDLLVTNPGGANRLYRNTGTGSFVSVGTGPLVTETNGFLYSTWVDYDNDGDLDLFCTSMFTTNNALFRNEGGWVFRKMTEAEVGPLVADGNAGAAAWGDYDNDGNLDVFLPKGVFSPTKSSLYHNNGDGTFTRVTTGSPVNDISYAGACDWVDYDQDGFLDLFVRDSTLRPTEPPMQSRLYHNNGNTNRWLVVKCVGAGPPFSPRLGTGAKVRAKATIRGKPTWQLRLIDAGGTSTAGQSYYAHFGLGDATNVTTLRIQWPSGIVQELHDVPVNQFLTIVEGQTGPALAAPQMRADGVFQFTLIGATNRTYRIEVSEDLAHWNPTRTVVLTDRDRLNVELTNVPAAQARFYRAVQE